MRRRIFAVVRAALGLAVLGYIVTLVQVDAIRPIGERSHIGWAVLALVFLAINCWVAAWRWRTLLLGVGVRERIAPLLRAIYVGAFYNLVLPGQLGGQAIKVMIVGRRSPALPAILASVAMDQVVVIIGLFFVAEMSTATASQIGHRTGFLLGFGIALLAAVLLLVFVVSHRVQGRLLARVRRSRLFVWLPDGLRHQTATAWKALASYGREPGVVVWTVAQAVIFLLTLGGMAIGLARAVGIELDPQTIVFVLMLGLVAGVAPFTLAGLGTREAAFTAAFTELGVPRATGAAFALLWLVLNSLADLVGGGMQFWHPRQTGTLEAPRPRRAAAAHMEPAEVEQ
jgi:uncharacterized membrane protein YbhN (UPF0104 family)